MPSLHEGLPMVAIEALQRGLAIVGSQIGGMRDVVEEGRNGFLCELSPAAFAQKLGVYWRVRTRWNECVALRAKRRATSILKKSLRLTRASLKGALSRIEKERQLLTEAGQALLQREEPARPERGAT